MLRASVSEDTPRHWRGRGQGASLCCGDRDSAASEPAVHISGGPMGLKAVSRDVGLTTAISLRTRGQTTVLTPAPGLTNTPAAQSLSLFSSLSLLFSHQCQAPAPPASFLATPGPDMAERPAHAHHVCCWFPSHWPLTLVSSRPYRRSQRLLLANENVPAGHLMGELAPISSPGQCRAWPRAILVPNKL